MTKTTSRRQTAKAGGAPAPVAAALRAAGDKKASDVAVLDLRAVAGFTDYFLICSGNNARQIRAIADAVDEALRRSKLKPGHVEGYERAEWILMDYFDFVVHIFNPETRVFYSLERLWGSAERLVLPPEPPGSPDATRP